MHIMVFPSGYKSLYMPCDILTISFINSYNLL